MKKLEDRNILQLLRTSGSTLQLKGDILTDENGVSLKCEHITIKEGELIIAMDNEKPKIFFLKNNGEFAEFVDKKEITTNEFVESRALIDLHNMIAVLKQIVGEGFYDGTLTEKINNLIQSVESLGGGAVTDYVKFLKEWIISDLGQYDNIDSFLQDLDSMANKSQKSGSYFALVNNIKCKVTLLSLDEDNNSFCQSIEAPITITDNNIVLNNNNRLRIISRVYTNNNWGIWDSLVYNDELPTCQVNATGTNSNYIYSKSGDTSHEVLSGTFRVFQENGNLKLQHKLWGSANNYNDAHKHTVEIPVVSNSANGTMNHNVYQRLLNNTISEQNSTTDVVKINYTNFNGNSNTLELSKVTDAKAGIVSVEQFNTFKNKANKSDIPTHQNPNQHMWPSYQINGNQTDIKQYVFSWPKKAAPQGVISPGNESITVVSHETYVDHRLSRVDGYDINSDDNNKHKGNCMLILRAWGDTDWSGKYETYARFPNATEKLDGCMSSEDKVILNNTSSNIEKINEWVRGSLGTFTTTNAFKTALTNMPNTHKGKYGRYYAILNSTYIFVTFVALEENSNSYSQWIEGPVIKSTIDDDIYLNNELGVHIIGRIYNNSTWGLWRSNVLDDEMPIPATTNNNGLMTSKQVKTLDSIQSNYKDFGHFESEDAALAKISDISVCADNNIVHAHMTYANGDGKNTLILIQSIDGNMCRQIIYNKMKIFQRSITFTDTNRTEISWEEDWNYLFGDRLQWSKSGRKYILSQFGNGFNHDYTEPIPLADTDTDGLMSKEDKNLLLKIAEKLGIEN